ncbi:MAG: hypothetical protein K0U76_06415 [Actinomycetia bacterium]|nr:hypothetical protein [Actinomycetes bacterium]MCH9701012.1 hypothetical protein [Actinomycetes bacterium]MCH9760431.1 hypothetical protein [Actinomycetes bacterium]
MNASSRTALTTGVAALSLGTLAVAVSVPPESMRTIQVVRPANFAADIVPGGSGETTAPPSEQELDSALALIEQLAPVADGRVVTVRLSGPDEPGSVTIAPTAPKIGSALEADSGSAEITHHAAVDDPVAQNAASDLIDDVYSVSRYWANYVSLELGPWLINWIPGGYLVSDQIYIWYPNFVLPTVDSFVYDFLDPVVNDPLNLEVWLDGIGDILSTAGTGIAAGIAEEINYIVTFGWFPIPLPPLPDFPLPGLSPTSAPAATSLAPIGADQTGMEGAAEDATEATEATEPADTPDQAAETTEAAESDNAAEVTDTAEVDEPADTPDGTTETTDDIAPDEATAEEATDAVAEDESADETTLIDAVDAVESGESAAEPDTELSNEPEPAVESVETEESGVEADIGTDARQDSASGSGESDSDTDSASDSDSATSAASESSEG